MRRFTLFTISITLIIISTIAFANSPQTMEKAISEFEQITPTASVVDTGPATTFVSDTVAQIPDNIAQMLLGDINVEFTVYFMSPAATKRADMISIHSAAPDGLNIVLNQSMDTPEVTTGKMPTIVADNTTDKLYLDGGKNLDIIPASGLASAMTEIYRTAIPDVIGQRTDGAISEDLVDQVNLANVRTLDVDGTVDARKTYENASNTTVTGEIAVNTSTMFDEYAANDRKEISDGATVILSNIAMNINLMKNTAIDISMIRKEINNMADSCGIINKKVTTTSAGGIAQIALVNENNFATTLGAGMTLLLV